MQDPTLGHGTLLPNIDHLRLVRHGGRVLPHRVDAGVDKLTGIGKVFELRRRHAEKQDRAHLLVVLM